MTKSIWGMDKLDLFTGLNAMEMQEMTKISTKVCYQNGDIISDTNNNSRDVYVLIEGRVDIVSLNGIPLYRVSAGEIFGEMALVPGIKRTAEARAREESWVLIVNVNHLEAIGEEMPNLTKVVTGNIIRSLGSKLSRADKLIELLKTELTKSLKHQG